MAQAAHRTAHAVRCSRALRAPVPGLQFVVVSAPTCLRTAACRIRSSPPTRDRTPPALRVHPKRGIPYVSPEPHSVARRHRGIEMGLRSKRRPLRRWHDHLRVPERGALCSPHLAFDVRCRFDDSPPRQRDANLEDPIRWDPQAKQSESASGH